MGAEARTDFFRRLDQVRQPVRAGTLLSATLPGSSVARARAANSFGAQNPSELGDTGGLIGAWSGAHRPRRPAQLRRLHHDRYLTASDARDVEGPDPDFEAGYRRFAAPGHGSNLADGGEGAVEHLAALQLVQVQGRLRSSASKT